MLTWIGVLAAQVSPGPNLVAVASVALSQGRRPALLVVTGVASGMLAWSTATAFGLGVFIDQFPIGLLVMKYLGGAYLFLLGLKAAKSAVRDETKLAVAVKAPVMSSFDAWQRGLLVVLTNPKAALMWAAVASFLFGHGLNPLQVLAFGPLGALSGLAIYGTYAYLFSIGAVQRGYSRFSRWFEGVLAIAFGAMGVSLIYSGNK